MIKSKAAYVLAVMTASLLTLTLQVRGGSITNNFDTSYDFMANGVPGSMWDGVYLGAGDIYGGDNAGDVGYTLQANETANPGYLTVQSSQTDWAGSGDDGFFLFKVVSGDFDVSVQNVAPWENPNYHQGGLLVRAFTANAPHWGAPYGGAENNVFLARFQEFSIGEDIRYATNGVDVDGYIQTAGDDTDLSTSRYYRITRVGNVFNFYTKTNQADAWVLQGSLTRDDLDGAPMQVGIGDAAFGSGTPSTYYTDFELTGTNVVASVAEPASPTGLVVTPSGANVIFSWTPGAGSDGSMLVLRKNNPLVLSDKPINGYAYTADTNFANGDDIGSGVYAVYIGAGNSVTVSGLGSTNQHYTAAVYSYSGSGATLVYGTSPATNSASGTGIPQGINFALTPSNDIALNGAGIPVLMAYDNIGNTDTLDNASATWSSSDPSILLVGLDGTVTGIALGTADIIASYGDFMATNSVTVHAPVFTDDFSTSHNYLGTGLPGSVWDGLYARAGDVPNSPYGGASLNTTAFNANISSNNALTITAANSGWEGDQDNGPFLFKVVPGDFTVSVHITGYNQVAYNFVGLMARAFDATDNASPSGSGYSENHLNWWRFDQYGVTTSSRNTVDSGTAVTDQNDGEASDFWLLMQRVNATNFYFFKRATTNDAWLAVPAATVVRPDWTNGVPLQVGLAQSVFTANNGTVNFDSFALDAADISGGTPPSATTGLAMTQDPTYTEATLTWTPGTNSDGSASTSFVVMRAGAPVSAQPHYGLLSSPDSVFGQGTDLGGGNYVVYLGVGNTVTVSGLTPGVKYYAVVYGYSGSSTTKSFNIAGSTYTNTPPIVFTGITASMNGTIPKNGIGLAVVTAQIQGAGTLDVSTSVQITSGDTNIIAATNNVLTGLALGTATNTVTFESGTNTYNAMLVASVRAAGYSEDFGVSHDYITDGVTNTTWDGVYNAPGVIPGTTYTSDSLANISSADANVTSNNVLNVTSENVGWEFAQNDGFFLFKNVTGDFQASVHISYLNDSYIYDGASMVGYNNPGLLARAYGTNGSPYNAGGGETWVSFTRFDLFGIGTYARRTLNNDTLQSTQPNGFDGADTTSDTNLWLLIVRKNTTNFMFFQRQLATDPWMPTPNNTTYSLTNFAGLPLQVGLLAGGFGSDTPVTVGFDSFMLDEVVTGPVLTAGISGGNISVSWPATGTYTLQYLKDLSSTNWLPVTTSPVTVNGVSTVILPATNSTEFFRLAP